MTRKLILQNAWLGFLSWLIPFAVSLLFFKPGGETIVPYATFKCIMTVTGAISGCYLLYRYFCKVNHDYITNGVIVGLSWFLINILLDSLILIPMMKTGFVDYFMSIGLSYFTIPAISITIAFLLKRKTAEIKGGPPVAKK
jgi:uncharacterized membrane protein YpjA